MRNRGGFTIVEIVVAVLVLSVGVIALVGSSGMVTRMIGRGKISTLVAQRAERRLDRLRAIAASTNPPCTSIAFIAGSSAASSLNQQIAERWTISGTTTRTVVDTITYRVPGSTRTTVVSTLISCF